MIREERNMLPLMKILQDDSIKFPYLYMPEIQITNSDIFIQGKEVDLAVDGVSDIFWGIADKSGNIIDIGSPWMQYLPHGFLIRLHAPQKNLSADSLELDYIIDVDNVPLYEYISPQQDASASKLYIARSINMENGIYIRPDGSRVHIDDQLVSFADEKIRTMLFRTFIIHK